MIVKLIAPTSLCSYGLTFCYCAFIQSIQGIVDFCKHNKIDMVVVGPELPLAYGIANVLEDAGIKCFGPSKAGAQIEADKVEKFT